MQTTKLFELAKLQSAMIFRLDEKPIAGIKSTTGVVIGFDLSIALNFTRKQT